jgi:hypothetical protein
MKVHCDRLSLDNTKFLFSSIPAAFGWIIHLRTEHSWYNAMLACRSMSEQGGWHKI